MSSNVSGIHFISFLNLCSVYREVGCSKHSEVCWYRTLCDVWCRQRGRDRHDLSWTSASTAKSLACLDMWLIWAVYSSNSMLNEHTVIEQVEQVVQPCLPWEMNKLCNSYVAHDNNVHLVTTSLVLHQFICLCCKWPRIDACTVLVHLVWVHILMQVCQCILWRDTSMLRQDSTITFGK